MKQDVSALSVLFEVCLRIEKYEKQSDVNVCFILFITNLVQKGEVRVRKGKGET